MCEEKTVKNSKEVSLRTRQCSDEFKEKLSKLPKETWRAILDSAEEFVVNEVEKFLTNNYEKSTKKCSYGDYELSAGKNAFKELLEKYTSIKLNSEDEQDVADDLEEQEVKTEDEVPNENYHNIKGTWKYSFNDFSYQIKKKLNRNSFQVEIIRGEKKYAFSIPVEKFITVYEKIQKQLESDSTPIYIIDTMEISYGELASIFELYETIYNSLYYSTDVIDDCKNDLDSDSFYKNCEVFYGINDNNYKINVYKYHSDLAYELSFNQDVIVIPHTEAEEYFKRFVKEAKEYLSDPKTDSFTYSVCDVNYTISRHALLKLTSLFERLSDRVSTRIIS